MFYINLLEPWHKLLLKKNFCLGPIEHPKVVSKWYKVKAILCYKFVKNKFYYKVKWLKWLTEDFIWGLVDYFNNCEHLLKEY